MTPNETPWLTPGSIAKGYRDVADLALRYVALNSDGPIDEFYGVLAAEMQAIDAAAREVAELDLSPVPTSPPTLRVVK